jgi:hypothetical protein
MLDGQTNEADDPRCAQKPLSLKQFRIHTANEMLAHVTFSSLFFPTQ